MRGGVWGGGVCGEEVRGEGRGGGGGSPRILIYTTR